ncbi:MAG: hypothetical protein U5J64_01370 [Halobacteriales archaeon]|nr:hypothetical protein [Halobacteriales archaeon]
MTENTGGGPRGESGDTWKKPHEEEEKEDYSIRESAFGGDETSEYIRGTILDASEQEAESRFERDMNRSETWLAERITDSGLPEFVYRLNPWNYSMLDWIFASGFVLMLVSAFVLFWTDSFTVAVFSLVAMFLSFCAMLLCVGLEGALKEGVNRIRDYRSDAEEGFESGEAFEEEP